MGSANSSFVEQSEAVLPVIRRYVRHFLGRSPESIEVQHIDGMLVIRLSEVLTDAEQRLYQSDPSPAGQEMVEQVFRKLVRQTKEALTGALSAATNWSICSVLCDVDCSTGEAVILLSYE